jgi:biopolymer transport protein ExbD
MKRRSEVDDVNLTPMIDIVFQMIIFFVTTVDLDKAKFEDDVLVPDAPHAEKAEPEPATIYVQVKENGTVWVGNIPIPSDRYLRGILTNAMKLHGQQIPVVIHADGRVQHRHVRRVMDLVSSAGLWRINFSAIVKEGK